MSYSNMFRINRLIVLTSNEKLLYLKYIESASKLQFPSANILKASNYNTNYDIILVHSIYFHAQGTTLVIDR